ncbi:MAG: hypothetical protein ACHQ2Y_01850 [Candidatus Lutacidiplasmatales archaeon]
MTAAAFARKKTTLVIRIVSLAPALLCAMVVISSGAGAGSASAVHRPPFKMVKDAGKDSVNNSGTGSLTNTTPFFHGSSGYGGYSAKAVFPRCGGSCNGVHNDNPATLVLQIQIPAPQSATSVVVNASLIWDILVHAKLGACRYSNTTGVTSQCALKMSWLFIIFQASLYDSTTATNHRARWSNFTSPGKLGVLGETWGMSWENVTGCAPASFGSTNTCGSSGALPTQTSYPTNSYWLLTFQIPTTTTKHQYLFDLSFLWTTNLLVSSTNARWISVSASISDEMAKLGQGIFIHSITVS